MPYKFNDGRRRNVPKAKYRVANWPDYDAALVGLAPTVVSPAAKLILIPREGLIVAAKERLAHPILTERVFRQK